MELNGKELETRYIAMAVDLVKAKKEKYWHRVLWTGIARKKLRKRLLQLQADHNNGLVCDSAFKTWSNLINCAIS